MTKVYLLSNQDGYFLNNQQEWVDGRDAKRIYRTVHKDEALNTKAELTVKSADIRIEIITCGTNDKGVPQIPESLLPALSTTLNIDAEPVTDTKQADLLQAGGSDAENVIHNSNQDDARHALANSARCAEIDHPANSVDAQPPSQHTEENMP